MRADELELVYWSENGGVSLPLDDWQYDIIIKVLGLSLSSDERTSHCATEKSVLQRCPLLQKGAANE